MPKLDYFEKKIWTKEQDSLLQVWYLLTFGSALDRYSEGPGFKSCRLQLNFQLEKGCGRDSMQYAIKYGCIELILN